VVVDKMNIPIELFALFLGTSLALLGLGLVKKTGVIITISGMFVLFTSAITDLIIMGSIPESSTVSGSTTTYVMVDNTFEFTELHKIFLAVVGIFIMIVGFLYAKE
jgi:hypothetical protein